MIVVYRQNKRFKPKSLQNKQGIKSHHHTGKWRSHQNVASGGKGSKGSGGILRVKENNGWLGFYTILNFSHILTAWI